MAAKSKLISILGTNDYVICNYDEFNNCEYIQEALVKKYKDEISEVIVFATAEAIQRNWGTEGKYYRADDLAGIKKGDSKEGLKKKLNDIINEYDLNIKIKLVEISKGYTEEEIWDIFNEFLKYIEEEDIIYFDITHSFRYLTMLVMNILNYAKLSNNIEVRKIHYGLFESLGRVTEVLSLPIEKRNATILDLTSFDYLNDWVIGVDNFINTGDAKKIKKLTGQPVGKKLSNKGGLQEEEIKFFETLSKLARTLEEFNNEVKTTRGLSINETILDILDILTELRNYNLESKKELSPFIKLINKIEDKFKKFDENDTTGIKNSFVLLEWCKEHDLINQGLVILKENLTSMIAYKLNEPYHPDDNIKDKDYTLREIREEINTTLYSLADKTFNKEKFEISEEKHNEISEAIKDLIDKDELLKIYNRLNIKRNDVTHFGMSDNAAKESSNIISKFSGIVDDLNKLLIRNNYYIE